MVFFKAAVSVVLILLLPAVNYFLTVKRVMPPKNRDLLFARIGCILLVVGNLVVGLAPTSSLMLVGKYYEETLCITIQIISLFPNRFFKI